MMSSRTRVGMVLAAGLGFGSACSSVASGSGVLDLTPMTRPEIDGMYGFELQGTITAKACTESASGFWVAGSAFEKLPSLVSQAAAAAAYEAIAKSESADSIAITRLTWDYDGIDRVCATIHGRGIKLTKASARPMEHAGMSELSMASVEASSGADADGGDDSVARGFYCAASTSSTIGSCTRTEEKCESNRLQAKPPLGECEESQRAVCFDVLIGKTTNEQCYATAEACESVKGRMKDTTSACIIRR